MNIWSDNIQIILISYDEILSSAPKYLVSQLWQNWFSVYPVLGVVVLLVAASQKIEKMLEVSCSCFDPPQKLFRVSCEHRPSCGIEVDCSLHQSSATKVTKLGKTTQKLSALTTKPPTQMKDRKLNHNLIKTIQTTLEEKISR